MLLLYLHLHSGKSDESGLQWIVMWRYETLHIAFNACLSSSILPSDITDIFRSYLQGTFNLRIFVVMNSISTFLQIPS